VEVFLEDEKVEQVVPDDPQGSSCEELNPLLEEGKPRCI
jgi:hypothetical protein